MTEREVNTLIAEKVMGWKMGEEGPFDNCWVKGGKLTGYDRWDWQPATDISTAWQVVEVLARRKKDKNDPWMVTLRNWNYYGDRTYTALFRDCSLRNNEVEARADSPAKAICLAALKVVGVEVPA